MKLIIFDSSTLINLSMNGILDILISLRKNFNGKFIIPKRVKYETVDRPMKVKQFELGALRVQELINEKILELPNTVVDENELEYETREILKLSNKIFSSNESFIDIIQSGEAECLALSIIANKRGIPNLVAVDERTTRVLVERPENLKELLETKLHTGIRFHRENMISLDNIKIIRSAELVYLAHKKGLIKIGNGKLLDALLYGVKFKGCSISKQEIEEIKKL